MSKQKKWLEYFQSFGASSSFINQMHVQLVPKLNAIMNKEVDWSRVWLFVEPVLGVIKYEVSENGKNIGYFPCQIDYKAHVIDLVIEWKPKIHNKIIKVNDNVSIDEIEFNIREIELRESFINFLPSIHDQFIPTKLDFNYSFDIFCDNKKAYYHEGLMIIDTSQDNIEKLNTLCTETLFIWNQLDDAHTKYNIPKERGIFHGLGFKKWEDEKAVFLFDSGSSITGAFEFIFERIDQSGLQIKSIEIKEY